MTTFNPGDPCHARGGNIRGSTLSNRQLKKIQQRLKAKIGRRNEFGNKDLTPHNATRTINVIYR